MNHLVWHLLPAAPSELLNCGELPPLICQLLYNRGVSREQWQSFLEGDERLVADPFLLPDMPLAVSRIYHALLRGEKIAIYGDYDTDGITATAVLVQGLEALGARIIPYIPNRLEGHGLHPPALKSLLQQGATLVITADCGTTCYEEVAEAQKGGQDIIITDHHSCPDLLPLAVATVNPRRQDSSYPFPHLAGVGVAYKLLQALFSGQGRGEKLSQPFDLIALGTVTDIAPLYGENRYLVKQGIRQLNNPQRPGLVELERAAGLQSGEIDARAISWVLGPRLNAAGRVEHAYLSYHLLLTASPEEARRLAQELEKRNQERQRLLEGALAGAREMAQAQRGARLLWVSGPEFPPGVAGLVAGKLVDEFRVPAVVVREGKELSRASCRSIPEFDMVAALKEFDSLFHRYGGHPMAAGFNLPSSNLVRLRDGMVEKAQRELEGLDLRPKLPIDASIPLSQLDGKTLQLLQKLAPFGTGNPSPTFLSRVKVADASSVGSNGEHLRLKVKDGGITWHGVGFGLGEHCPELNSPLDLVYHLSVDRWGGQERLELHILDLRPTS